MEEIEGLVHMGEELVWGFQIYHNLVQVNAKRKENIREAKWIRALSSRIKWGNNKTGIWLDKVKK